MHPKKIKLIDKKKLLIIWDDGNESELELRELRKRCPCATCLAERDKQGKKYIPLFRRKSDYCKINRSGW